MPSLKRPVVVVGSVNMDLVANTERIPAAGETLSGTRFATHPGGKGANQAVAIARLGYPVAMIGRLGTDAFSKELKEQLERAGVDTEGVRSTEGACGVALIVVSAAGENSIVVVPGANAALTPEDLDNSLALIRSAGMVLTQLETPIETLEHLAVLCSREGIPLMLDPAPACPLSLEVLRRVDWFTPNETEAAFYNRNGQAPQDAAAGAQQLLSLGPKNVVLKLGQRGAFVQPGGSLGDLVESFPVASVDTTAAGDCFNGAFAVGLLEGMGPVTSARFANAAASLAVTRKGAQASMSNRQEVEMLLQSGSPRRS